MKFAWPIGSLPVLLPKPITHGPPLIPAEGWAEPIDSGDALACGPYGVEVASICLGHGTGAHRVTQWGGEEQLADRRYRVHAVLRVPVEGRVGTGEAAVGREHAAARPAPVDRERSGAL